MTAIHPLTTFEEYMLHDDCVEHPMTFFLRVNLQGAVQGAKLQSSFDEVVRRHPIFWSKVTKHGRNGLVWQPDPDRIPSLQIETRDNVGECPLKSYIDLTTQPGIRAVMDIGAASTELWLQFHHSCCDGMAAIEFLDELIQAYGRHTTPLLAPSAAAHGAIPKHVCVYTSLTRWQKTKRLWRDLRRIGTFSCRRLVRPTTPILALGTTVDCPVYVEARLPMTSSIRAQLKCIHPLPTTVNDVLLRDVCLALEDSMRAGRLADNRGWIRLAVAMNLRRRGASSNGCRNNMSLSFIDRRVGKADSKDKLLRSIRNDMTQIKRYCKGYTMLRALHWLRSAPCGLASIATFKRALTTVVVSNLGEVLAKGTESRSTVAGHLEIAGLGFLVPIRMGTPISFGVQTYANEMTLSMQYDPRLIDRLSADKLLSDVVRYLAGSLADDHDDATRPLERRAA